MVFALSTGGELNIFSVENKVEGTSNINVAKEKIPVTAVRTPGQYGQQPILPASDSNAVGNLDRSAPSAFR